ncbi:MAG: terminase [Muribaculaceae bacterium]|nr:terminase [Muribaculaceae bacterium]
MTHSNTSSPSLSSVEEILRENRIRLEAINSPYDPIAGDPNDPERVALDVPGLAKETLWIPRSMATDPMVASLKRAGDINAYIDAEMHVSPSDSLREVVRRKFSRLRIMHDFPFWAASFVFIKTKGGGEDSLFSLNRPQRKLVAALERMRREEKPIRLILLKARQWGGSTCVQLYMAWLQLVHRTGLNSLIIAHQGLATDEIKDMFDRMLRNYPDWLLTDSDGNPVEGRRMENAGGSRGAFRVNGRNCKVKLGSAERPDSCRGGDYNLVHCSEVGIWRATQMKTPEQLIRAACSGILLKPMTMIALESTANGTGNYFHREYEAAKNGESQFCPLFVAWYDIDQYSLPLSDPHAFATALLEGKDASIPLSDRRQPGAYLWWLWEKGATLEAINWYMVERSKYSDHGLMAAEYPSDDIEAFVHSGARVFDKYKVEKLRAACRQPAMRGEIDGDSPSGPDSIRNTRFNEDSHGGLAIWKDREIPGPDCRVSDRYLVVVDIGGRSAKADWSVVAVFDRMGMDKGEPPEIVAQWRGHSDIDILAWNAARIAAYYCDALLVVESNTLETHDPQRQTDGDQSLFILNQIRDVYPNLYARRQSEEDVIRGEPRKYGFHTNTATKPMVISQLVKAIREGLYVERDEACLDEYLTYEQRPNGSFGALPGRHDDILMTRAIGLHICFNEMPMPRTALVGRMRHRVSGSSSAFF